MTGLSQRFGFEPSGGAWPEPARSALVAPLLSSGTNAGFLVVGANPRRAVDDEYVQFVERACVLIANAVTSAKVHEAERKRAEMLSEIDRAKTAFFSNVSHEFRTPLTLMLGPLEDMRSQPALDGEERVRLELVHRNALRLLKLVNTLLDFSRIEAGRVEASYAPVDLSVLTADLASSFRSATERAGLTLEIECEPLAEPVYVDQEMWEKIVLNHLSNAFKFTFAGTIRVRLYAEPSSAVLEVSDTGIGISEHDLPRLFERFHRIEGARSRSHEGSAPEHLPHIFERFRQVDSSTTRSHGGLGLGLAIVRHLVEAHGGFVTAESPGLDEGTTFTVTLPFDAVDDKAPTGDISTPAARPGGREAEATLAPRPLTAVRILLVDDEPDSLELLRDVLEGAGAHVTQATSGRAALALTGAFDVIVSDIGMPEIDGYALLRALRSSGRSREVPAIAVSAYAGTNDSKRALEAGYAAHLAKPLNPERLLETILQLLPRGSA